jgi:hypothetical protein
VKLSNDLLPALAIGAGVAGVAYLVGSDDGARELESTGATSNEGAPVAPVGGISDYIKVYIAQRTKAVELFGEQAGSNNKAVPLVTREYAIEQVIRFWQAEVNHQCGLDDGGSSLFGFDTTRQRVDYSNANHPGLNPLPVSYKGIVSFDSARTMVTNFNRHAVKLRQALVAGTAPFSSPSLTIQLSLEGADEFWTTIGDLAIDVDVDRATPNYTGGAYLWAAIVQSAQELPGRLGEAAREAAAALGKGTLFVLWHLLEPLLTSPWVLGAAGVYVYLQRAELLALARRLHV